MDCLHWKVCFWSRWWLVPLFLLQSVTWDTAVRRLERVSKNPWPPMETHSHDYPGCTEGARSQGTADSRPTMSPQHTSASQQSSRPLAGGLHCQSKWSTSKLPTDSSLFNLSCCPQHVTSLPWASPENRYSRFEPFKFNGVIIFWRELNLRTFMYNSQQPLINHEPLKRSRCCGWWINWWQMIPNFLKCFVTFLHLGGSVRQSRCPRGVQSKLHLEQNHLQLNWIKPAEQGQHWTRLHLWATIYETKGFISW